MHNNALFGLKQNSLAGSKQEIKEEGDNLMLYYQARGGGKGQTPTNETAVSVLIDTAQRTLTALRRQQRCQQREE